VDDRKVVAALHHVARLPGHVVAQVVETELVVRAVRDIRLVLLPTLRRRLARQDAARRHPQRTEYAPHELRLVAREVVVDRDHVNTAARDRVEVGRQYRHQRLTLTGLHLSDIAQVQGRATHQLNVVRTQTDRAPGRLPHRSERLRQQVVERLARRVPLPQLARLVAQVAIGERPEVVLESVHRIGVALQSTKKAAFTTSQDAFQNVSHEETPKGLRVARGRATAGASVRYPSLTERSFYRPRRFAFRATASSSTERPITP